MSWKQHKSKEKHIIGGNKLITRDITVQNSLKTDDTITNYFDGEGVLQSPNVIDSGREYNLTSAKALVKFLENNTLDSSALDPSSHWFRNIEQESGNVIYPSIDTTTTTGKGCKIGAYNANHQYVEDGSGTLEFISDISLGKNFYVSGTFKASDASFDRIGSISQNKALQIVTDTSFQKNVEIANSLTVKGDVSLNHYLFVGKDVSVNNHLFVNGDVSINNYLMVPDVSFDNIGSLYDNRALQIVNVEPLQHKVEISNNLTVRNDVSMNENLFVGNDVSINTDLFVNKDVSINTLLRVPDASFDKIAALSNNELQIVTDVSFQGMVEIPNDLNITYGEVSFNKLLIVPDASFYKIGSLKKNEALQILSDASFQNNVEIAIGVMVTNGDVSFNHYLFVDKNVTINNNLFVNNDISVNNDIFIDHDVSINNDLFVNNYISVNNDMFVGKDVSINNYLFVKSDVSINKLLRVPDASFDKIGSLTENEPLQILPEVSFQGIVEILII